MVKLGAQTDITHVVYQAISFDAAEGDLNGVAGSKINRSVSGFQVVGTNDPDFASFDVLATAGVPAAATQAGDANTDLWVFPVSGNYQYVGILQSMTYGATIMTLAANTLQVYANAADVEEPEVQPTAEPTAPPILPPEEVTTIDVAQNKAAFSYNSKAGTNPSLAIDGKEGTYWESKGASGMADNFVIDLGAEYSVYAVDILPARADSAQNITVYGSNKNAADAQAAENQTKVVLGSTDDAELSTTEATKIELASPGHYRYIMLEQAANSPTLALAEIKVYAAESQVVSAAEPVSIISKGKTAVAAPSGIANRFANIANVSDDDPSTGTSAQGNNTISPDGMNVLLDLGEAMPVSHLVYQAQTYNSEAQGRSVMNFTVVGTNDANFAPENMTVLATAGAPAIDFTTADRNTDLWVFPIESDTNYRYIGVNQNYPSGVKTLSVNTLQAYAKISDMEEYVATKGENNIVATEYSAIEGTQITYEATVLNGADAGSVVGFFNHYDDDGNLIESMQVDGGYLSAGSYNDLYLAASSDSAEDGMWDLTIVSGGTVLDYIGDVDKLERPEAYAGTKTATLDFKQTGNTISASGMVGANVAGLLVLKSGVTAEAYTEADIISCQFVNAPEGAAAPWAYQFRFTMPATAEPGNYHAYLMSDNGALAEAKEITIYDVSDITSDFSNVTAENFLSKVSEHAGFFGDVLVAELEAADASTIGTSFMLAKEGFTEGIFDETLTDWSNINTIVAALEAALVIEATDKNANVAEAVEAHGAVMADVFIMADYNGDEFEDILPEVVAAVEPEDAAAYATVYQRTLGLSLIAGGKLSDKERAIKEYSKALGIDDETFGTKYTKRAIAEKLSNNMNTVKNQYASGMDATVEKIVKDLKNASGGVNQLGNNGGGGRGGSSSGSMIASKPYDFIGTNEANDQPAQGDAPATETKPGQSQSVFNDVANHGWAIDAVNLLNSKGILSGVGDGSFRPDEYLTREQAAKILVLVMDLPSTANDNGYIDCAYGSWYYPYITAAKENGLINGISRTGFGVGQLVTRQDLAVMIYRALQKSGLAETEELAAFIDNDAIADYAKEAVSTLGGMGMISGFADGSFGGGQNTTRAQAAVMFARLLDRIQNAPKEVAAE